MKLLFTFSTILTLFINICTSQTSTRVLQGQKIKNSLTKDEVHNYSMQLDSAQYIFGHVMQQSVDVIVKIKNPKGNLVKAFDGPAKGPENFQIETEKPGTYIFEVSAFEDNEGDYLFEILLAEPVAKNPEQQIAQLMTPYTGEKNPGAEALVMKDGKIIFERAFGMANLTYNVPFTPETPTNIGSTSKQFTAFAIQLLAERGKLSLDDDIRKYFPELPDFGKKVSIRNLLTHTSGYREFLNTLAMTGRDLSSDLDKDMLFKLIKNQPKLQNIPGTEWNYNNTGYAILANLVQEITNTPFPVWMKKNIFDPLGMDHTIVRANQNQVVENRATGYGIGESGEYEELQDLGGAMGAGGIYTTLEDLAKWIRNFKDPKIGNKKILKEMMTPYVLKSGDSTIYGFGLFIGNYRGLKLIQHGGSDVAHRSMLMYFPDIDAAVITQSNNAGFSGSTANKIANIYFSDFMEMPKKEENEKISDDVSFEYSSEDFEMYTGRYELDEAPGFILTFKRDGERIYSQATGQPEIDLKPESDSVFAVKGVNAKVTFHTNENGSADSLTLHQNGNHIAHKITWKPSLEELKEFSGKYFSDEIETLYTLSIREDHLVMNNYQIGEDIKLKPGDKDGFAAGFPISDLSFKRNEEDKIVGFFASNGRVRGVYFKKLKE